MYRSSYICIPSITSLPLAAPRGGEGVFRKMGGFSSMENYFFLKKKWVKVWWIEMFVLLLQRTIFQREAAKLSHHPTDEGYFFVRKRCSLILSIKRLHFI